MSLWSGISQICGGSLRMCAQLHVLRTILEKIPMAVELGPCDFGGSLNPVVHLFCMLWYFRAV